MKKNSPRLNTDDSFFDNPKMIQRLLRIFYSICFFLVAVDFIIHRHISTDVERIPAFYAIYGFVVCAVLVIVARLLRKLLMREEYYYSDIVRPPKAGGEK